MFTDTFLAMDKTEHLVRDFPSRVFGDWCVTIPIIFEDDDVVIFEDFSINLADFCVQKGLVESKGELRKHMKNNAFKLNRKPFNDINKVLTGRNFTPQGFLFMNIGKKIDKVAVIALKFS